MKKYLLTFALCIGFLGFINAQTDIGNKPSPGETGRIKIEQNEKVVRSKAKKYISEVWPCSKGFKIEKVELYRGGIYKVHFKTHCKISGEVHYYAKSADYKGYHLD